MSRKYALFSKRKQDLCMKLEELKDEGDSVVNYVRNIIDQGTELVGDLEGVSDHVVFLQRYPAVIKELDRLLNKIVRLNCNIELNTSDDEVEEKVQTERCVTEEVLLRSKSTIHNSELLTPESSVHLSTGHDVNSDTHNYPLSPEVTHSVPPCPVHIGDILDMRFLHGNSPHNFWLGYYKSRSLDCLNETMLSRYHMKHLLPCDMSLLFSGTYVCAFDGKKCFRGKILRIRFEQPVRLMVLDVDSGRIRKIEQDSVFRLDEEFSKTPVQALNCCLRGNLGDPLLWDEEVAPLFCKLLTESALVVTVCEKDRGDPPQFRVDVDCHNEKRINNKIDVNKWVIFSVIPKLKEMKEDGKGDGILKCLYTYLDPVIRDEEDSTEQGFHSDSGCFTEISTPLSQISHSTVSCSVMPVKGENQFHSQDHEHTTSLSHVELAPCSDIKIQPAESTQNLNLGTDCKVRTELNQSSSAPETLGHSKECDKNHLTSSSFHVTGSHVTNNVTAESTLLLPDKNISLHQPVLVSSAGQSYKAMLSHIEDPGEFYIHIVCEDNIEIDSLQNGMTRYYRTVSPAFKSKEEAKRHIISFCAAFYDVDNNWYRAQIIDWNEDNDSDTVIIKYVDYGNKSSVHFSMLQPLRAEFTELPICARRCHLAMICPKTSTEDEIPKSWSHEATHLFKCLVNMESVYLVILMESIDDTMSSLSVILQDCQKGGCPVINEFIVELGYAVSFHPSVAQKREQGQNAQNSKTDNDSNEDSLCKEQLCAVDMSSDWNPMAEDYYSAINTLYHDDEDACYAVTGYKPQDEKRICRFYARTGRCYKGETCLWEHIYAHPDGWTTDKECMFTDAITKLVLPDVQDEILLQVTYITKVNMFYAVICNECQRSSDKVQIKRIDIKEEDEEKDETLVTLNDYLNEEHNVRALRSCTVMPALGQIVVARFSKDGRFYRARVMDYSDVEICVFYVDYGNREWVSESDIREIEPRYLHLPFQAVECVLANVDEVSENLDAKKFFASMVYNKTLHAQVIARLCHLSRLEVHLWDDERCDIGAYMIQNGYGRERIYREHSLVT
ncbi:hypothetical protein B7P43_G03215 [Cryptotermes secundus]|uniref:Tudor domain-containing protein 1 n=1 Tax=Cryptotermes secundus TaxID=105785 RepID=A0A2J7RRW2_9NEOP|nr:uncharacterized protein LOC111861681 isoform X1 [Cryptotermes secundus]PNF43578.1 hypothetical protein B7P43_G03215 [Cryptotermes secundus]